MTGSLKSESGGGGDLVGCACVCVCGGGGEGPRGVGVKDAGRYDEWSDGCSPDITPDGALAVPELHSPGSLTGECVCV